MSKEFDKIRSVCIVNSKISEEVIDNDLIYYADQKDDLEKKIINKLSKYKNLTEVWPKSYISLSISQLIAHEIFKADGLILKYIKHAHIKSLPASHQLFLKNQLERPWRYTFSRIISNPEKDFYEMEDVFTEESYLLYSPSLIQTIQERNPSLWLLMIADNGHCWQSFGLNIPLINTHVDDIFFYATEINPDIEDEEGIIEDLQDNPVPYLMFISLGINPAIHHKGHEMAYFTAHNAPYGDAFDLAALKAHFVVSWNNEIYELKPFGIDEFPHYAIAYFDERNNSLFRSAMTEEGFTRLSRLLKDLGYDIHEEAEVRLSVGVHHLLEKVMQDEVVMDPYREYFETEKDFEEEEKSPEFIAIESFMVIAIQKHNNKEKVDVAAIASQVGANLTDAKNIWNHFKNRLKNMK